MAVPPTERWGLAAARPPRGGAGSLQPRRTQDPRLQDWERTQLPPLPCLPKSLLSRHSVKAQWGSPTSRPPPPGSCARHRVRCQRGISHHLTSPSGAVRMATIRRWVRSQAWELPPARAQGLLSRTLPASPRPGLPSEGQKPGPGPPPAPSAPGRSPLQGPHCPLGTARRCGRRAPAALTAP